MPSNPPERTWQQVLSEVMPNAPSSAVNFGKGFYQTVRHPLNALENAGEIASGAVQLGAQGALPAPLLRAWNAADSNPAQTQREVQAARYVGDYYKNRYGSSSGFKNAIATDPVGVISDLSMVLGGAGALADTAKMGDLASSLKTASTITNPISIPTLPLRAPILRRIAGKPTQVMDGAGELTPQASAAVEKSKLANPDVFSHPIVQQHLSSLAGQKGVSPAVARQAVLQAAGVGSDESVVTHGMATGQLPANAAKGEIAQNAYGKAREAVAAKTASLAPDVAPDAVGSDFINSYLDGKNQVARAYHQPYSNSGTFSSDSIPSLRDHIETVLQSPENSTLPDSIDEFSFHSDPKIGSLPYSSSFLLSTKNSPSLFDNMQVMADQGKLSMNNVEQFRRGINRAMNGATPTDQAARRAIRDGLDSWVKHTAPDAAMFNGDGQAVVDEMNNARQTFQDFKNTFEQHPNPNIRDATKRIAPFVDDDGAVARLGQTAPANLPSDVQNVLLDGVYDAPTGSRPGGPRAAKGTKASGVSTFQDLHADPTKTGMTPLTQQGQQALQDTIRSRVYGSNPSSADLANITSGPYGHLFDDSAKADLGVQAVANDILNEKPVTPSSIDTSGGGVMSHAVPLGLGVASAAASHFLPQGSELLGGMAGLALGEVGRSVSPKFRSALEAIGNNANIDTELAGAPATYNKLPVGDAAYAALVASKAGQTPATSDTQQPESPTMSGAEFANEPAPSTETTPDTQQPEGPTMSGAEFANEGIPTPHASGGRTGYKAGGSVHKKGVEHLVKRLMDKAEKAKRLNNKATEPLLKLHDNTVAKALAIAQKTI